MKNHKFIINLILFAGLIFYLSSCTQFSSVSFKDPDFLNKTYHRICVVADIEGLYQRKIYENVISETLKESGIMTEEGLNLFPPTREWNDSDIHNTLENMKIEGYLLISFGNKYQKSVYIPASTTIETKKVKEKSKGTDKDSTKFQKDEYKETQIISENPARTEVYEFITVKVSLIDVKTSKKSWMCEIGGGGINTALLNDKSNIQKIAAKLVEDLSNDKVIGIKK